VTRPPLVVQPCLCTISLIRIGKSDEHPLRPRNGITTAAAGCTGADITGGSTMRTLAIGAMFAGLALLAGTATAEDKKANPTGTWKWSVERNGQKREITLKLKLDDGKLTGSVTAGKDTDTKIEDASFKDGEVKFSVTRERNGEKFTSKYAGKMEGDAIKGSYETTVGGKELKREWEAKREKTKD